MDLNVFFQFSQYVLGGACVGLLIGLTGVGGGSLMTPLLIMFGVPYNVAIGTDLLYASITKTGAVYSHSRQGTIRWRLVLWMGAGSIPASLVTAYALSNIFDNSDSYKEILTTTLGLMLVLTALVLFFRKRIINQSHENTGGLVHWIQQHARPVTFFTGIALGVLVTLSSVGAGAFGTAALMILYPRLPAINVVGTDLAHAVPLTLIAGLGHLLFLGNVDFLLLAALLVGSLPAVQLGTRLAVKLPNEALQPILATILLVLGVKFAFFSAH